jgi:hypothetical protein
MDRSPSRTSIGSRIRGVALFASLLALAACGDAPTAPELMDPNAIALVMPSVIDARLRLAARLADPSTSQRMLFEIQTLESALGANNSHQARVCVANIGDVLNSRRTTGGADAADLSAVELMLRVVTPVVRNTHTEIRFQAFP